MQAAVPQNKTLEAQSNNLCALSNTELSDSWCHLKRKGWLSIEGSELGVLCYSCVKPNKETYYPTFAHQIPPVPLFIPIPDPSHTHL